MFDPQTTPRVFYLPPGVPFAGALLDGLITRAGPNPLNLAQTQLYLNTRRAARLLEDLLARRDPVVPLLPRIEVLEGLKNASLPEPIAPLSRQLLLSQLTREMIARMPDLAAETAAFDLAGALADLLDELDENHIPTDRLLDLDVGDYSAHWKRSLDFLSILNQAWPDLRAEITQGAMDKGAHQAAKIAAQIAQWQQDPPDHPVIVAGSTASRFGTRSLMQTVSRLPQGAVVLPGFDPHLDPALWEEDALPQDHPQFGLIRFCRALGLGPGDPKPWGDPPLANTARNRLASVALRPAPVTDQWLDAAPALTQDITQSWKGLHLLEAPSPREEALAIAFEMRASVAKQQTVALITPDRALARRVRAELSRWGIIPDDSAGRPLHLTPPGLFLRHVLALKGAEITPAELITVLKHPLCGGTGAARGDHIRRTRRLELTALRGKMAFVGEAALKDWAKAEANPERQQPDPGAPRWADWLWATLSPLQTPGALPLRDRVALHQEVTLTLSKGLGDQDAPLFEGHAGAAIEATLQDLHDQAQMGGDVTLAEYRVMVNSLLSAQNVTEDAARTHSDVFIWGPLEARMQAADLTILGAVNEGIWPAQPALDPWLNRPMRAQIGLPLPERNIGLAAHDFQTALGNDRVLITRAVKSDGVPTVPSRWLNRLINLTQGLGADGKAALERAKDYGAQILAQAALVEAPLPPVPRATRPAPTPPIEARPKALSVTQIEKLIRDPFAIYARHVLRLKPLDPLGQLPNPGLRGTVVHLVLEQFLDHIAESGWPEAPEALLETLLKSALADAVPWPATRAEWQAWMMANAPNLIAAEQERLTRSTPLKREVTGHRKLEGVEFTLKATADRIDIFDGAALAIYDYKTGQPDTKKQITNFSKQLPLEGAIAQAGGFEGIAPNKVAHLEQISVQAKHKSILLEAELIAQCWSELGALIRSYTDPARGYTARARPVLIKDYDSDYDDLSRYREWDDSAPPRIWDDGGDL